MAAPAATDTRLPAHVKALRARLSSAFTIVVEPPFVVIGDASPEAVQAEAHETVGWAVRLLTRQFFDTPPAGIVDIYLFKDAQSYQRNTRSLFGETPSTPYGCYAPAHHALLMNIATGSGTLVHEMVHPYMQANFPDCPAWFNEGLASLYEACEERGGRIMGLVNWRLDGLQKAIRQQATLPLERLMALEPAQFYADSELTYAMARYLCFYLQQQGRLVDFYQRFRAAGAKDRTGARTLRQVLGEDDLVAFQARWERSCLELEQPIGR